MNALNHDRREAFRSYAQTAKAQAQDQWPAILQALAGLEDRQVHLKSKRQGVPCPLCGGQDRYSFKDPLHGGWACRHCGGGDGWALLQRINSWSFVDAVKAVGDYLHIELPGRDNNDQQARQAKAIAQAEQRKQAAQKKEQQDAARLAQQHQQKAGYAGWLWAQSPPADSRHPYLIKKGLPPFNVRQYQHPVYGWCLLIPLMNEQGQLMNLEQINPAGDKRPIKGGLKKGLFYQFGSDSFTVYVAEGWSTAAAVHLAKPNRPVVLAAMSAGNLEAVAGIACRRFPESQIVIAADHDAPGIQAAIKAACRYNLKIVIPEGKGDFYDSFNSAVKTGSKAHG